MLSLLFLLHCDIAGIGRMAPPDLLHSALNRAAQQAAESEGAAFPRGRLSPPSIESLSLAADSPSPSLLSPTSTSTNASATTTSAESEDDLIAVLTPFATPLSTPSVSRNTSRSSSPTRRAGSTKGSGAGKPRRDKSKELAKAQANKLGADGTGSRDPLARLENTLSGRIFQELGSEDLLACGAVCRKWRNSQTLSQSLTQSTTSSSHSSAKRRKERRN